MTAINRRDFLKISSTLLGTTLISKLIPTSGRSLDDTSNRPNVLILLFDTLSAPHMSLYGYKRETTPNLARFADKATVFHSHYSAGSFTTPGTASILTGLLPWNHRAINFSGLIRRDLQDNNIFKLAGDEYYKIGFSQNLWADIFLRQFDEDLDLHLPSNSFSYQNHLLLGNKALNDPLPYLAYDDFLVGGFKEDVPYSGSITLGILDAIINHGVKRIDTIGKPSNGYFYYENRMVFQGIYETLKNVYDTEQRPFLGYFHLWSPHEPYSPQTDFKNKFHDNLKFRIKPKHSLVDNPFRNQELNEYRLAYDQYIADVDSEFGFLMARLQDLNILENTCVIVMSDHGQLFERGLHGHLSRLMYDEGIHTPLIISSPRQTTRMDVHVPTGNTDLFPTLAAVMGKSASNKRFDGKLLPGFGGQQDPERSVFSIEAKENPAFQSLAMGSFVLIKGMYKLIFYTGYPGHEDIVELYNLAEDPYEMKDLSSIDTVRLMQMKEELLAGIHDADESNMARSG